MKPDFPITSENRPLVLPKPRSSTLSWLVFLCFAAGIVAGGQIAASRKSEETMAQAQQQSDLESATFFKTEGLLRRKIFELNREIVALRSAGRVKRTPD